jgi:hypothetical protein
MVSDMISQARKNSQGQTQESLKLEIDQTSAIQHLSALGYQHGEKVYLRTFPAQRGAGFPRKLEAEFPNLPWSELNRLQNQGGGIYFVVNGGGHRNTEVASCKAIFYEHDNIPKEQQLTLWKSLKLPQPTIQVDTGGKSIHSYWRLDCSVSQWCDLQADLLEYADGDRSLKNPSRVMRLAGSWHIKTFQQSTIIKRF